MNIDAFCQHAGINFPSTHTRLQVNASFDSNQDAVLRFAHGLTLDLNCMFFSVGGGFVVTIRVVSAVVSAVVLLTTLLK